MPDKGRTKPCRVLWSVLGICLVSLGCQAQFTFLDGPVAASAKADKDYRAATQDSLDSGPDPSGVVQAAHKQTEKLAAGVPASPVSPTGPAIAPQVLNERGEVILARPAESGTAERDTFRELSKVSLLPSAHKQTEKPAAAQPRVAQAAVAPPGPVGPTGPAQAPQVLNERGEVILAGPADSGPAERDIPRELSKVSLPPYVIEPPDILLIDAVRLTPRPPYRLDALDVLQITVADTLPNQPIAGLFSITPEGTVNLGFSYGVVRISGLTVEQAQSAIQTQLTRVLRNPLVSVTLAQFRGLQQTRGEHLVRPDGTIGLGTYGGVYVTGMTIAQAKCAIERHLAQYLMNPELSLDVYSYNSKVYYVITDGAGFGEQVYRFPSTGNETVLDAISQIYGLPAVASKRRIWVARPAPSCLGCDQVLPVDWRAITQGGSTDTNYQIFPGDRVYVHADCLIRFDNIVAKVLAPIERLFGVTLLGTATVNEIRNSGRNNGSGFVTGF